MLPGRNQPTTAATDHIHRTDIWPPYRTLFKFCTGGKRTDPSSQFSVFYIRYSFPRLLSSRLSPSHMRCEQRMPKKIKIQQRIHLCSVDYSSSEKELRQLQYGALRSISGSQPGGRGSEESPESLQQREHIIIVNNIWIKWADYSRISKTSASAQIVLCYFRCFKMWSLSCISAAAWSLSFPYVWI